MAKATLLILKLLMILICAAWFTLWILKPTELWTKKWHTAEDSARTTVFGYYGMKFSPEKCPCVWVIFSITSYGENEKKDMKLHNSTDFVLNHLQVLISLYIPFLLLLWLQLRLFTWIFNPENQEEGKENCCFC